MELTIEIYIHEGLPTEAEDQLWIIFLKQPDWYSYFDTMINLYAISNRRND